MMSEDYDNQLYTLVLNLFNSQSRLEFKASENQ